tara:strand:+ start:135 stop:386 length:252 start_codon:yes stop_codon:yes gene_type:complete
MPNNFKTPTHNSALPCLAAFPTEIPGLLKQTGNKNPFNGERFDLFTELWRLNDKGAGSINLDQFKETISRDLLFEIVFAHRAF